MITAIITSSDDIAIMCLAGVVVALFLIFRD
jgi:hypothetical protein